MEAEIRGLIENMIDDMTSEEELSGIFALIGLFKPLIKSNQDAVFGIILARSMTNLLTYYHLKYKRAPTISESQQFKDMILERSNTIMSRIKIFSNR